MEPYEIYASPACLEEWTQDADDANDDDPSGDDQADELQ